MKKAKAKYDICAAVFVFLMIFVRYIMYGFTYFHQLDDYIQYYQYHLSAPWATVLKQGLLSSRPLAGLSDLYIWGGHFEHMLSDLCIISILYAISAVLFLKVFRKHFKTGIMFTLFYAVEPFFFEGVYWISASTRIVLGLFFLSLAVFLLDKFFEKKKTIYFGLFWVFQLISIGFYEQILALSTTLCIIAVLLNIDGKKKNLIISVIPLFNVILYFVFTTAFAKLGTALTKRMVIAYPSFTPWYANFIGEVLRQIRITFINVPAQITFGGFVRGIRFIVTDKLWYAALIAVAFAIVMYKFAKQEDYAEKYPKKGLTFWVATLIAIAPVSIFFVIGNPYFSLRNAVPSFLGLAILFDMAFSFFAKYRKKGMCVLAGALAGVFFISSVSELRDYKAVHDFDIKVISNIKYVLDENELSGRTAFIFQNGDKGEMAAKWHERGYGAVSSDWAAYGVLGWLGEGKRVKEKIMPIETDDNIYHYSWEKDDKIISGFDNIYYWNENGGIFTKLVRHEIENGDIELLTEDGQLVAVTKEHNDVGYIFYY